MIDVQQALKKACEHLKKNSPTARLDAEVLLAFILGKSRTFLHTHSEFTLSSFQWENYSRLISNRCEGTPIAYITGTREFWSLPIHVNKDTLIPRPETEQLVELTLALLDKEPHASVLDLGTGSGAIALAIASERPNWDILASDVSQGAVNMTLNNAARLELKNIHVLCSDWFESIPSQPFHAIISNPPYIAELDAHLTQGDIRFEPRHALISGVNGLDALTHIIKQSYDRLLPGGFLLLEHGFDQMQPVKTLLIQYGYQNIRCWQDLQGKDRICGGWKFM